MTMVSRSRGVVYISGGRCATSSVTSALAQIPGHDWRDPARESQRTWDLYDKHMPARHVRASIGREAWDRAFSFTFVRNPYQWVVSSYGFWCKTGRCRMPPSGVMDMACFRHVVAYYQTPAGRRHDECTPIRSQHSFICDEDGRVIVDFVGRFEHLEQDFAYVLSRIGALPIALERKNASLASRYDWRDHYRCTPGAAELVREHWRRDIEAFGYSLDL